MTNDEEGGTDIIVAVDRADDFPAVGEEKRMTPRFNLQAFLLVLSLCIFIQAHVFAARAESPRLSPLRFGIMDLEPYGFKNPAGDWTGNLYEVAHAVLGEGSFEGSVAVLPIARLLKSALEAGTVDCSFFIASEFIEKNMVRVGGLGQTLNSGILPRPSLNLHAYDDLRDVRIGVTLGIRINDRFDLDETLTKIQVRDYNSAVMMLDRGRVDAIAGVIESLKFSARKAGLAMKYGTPLVFKNLDVNLYCAPNSPVLAYRDALKSALDRLVASGAIEEIMARYRESIDSQTLRK